MADPRQVLADSLRKRTRTTDVAQAIHDLMGEDLPWYLRKELADLAQQRASYWYMADDFDRVVGAERQIATYATLFDVSITEVKTPDAATVKALAALGMQTLGYADTPPEGVLSRGRLSAAERKRLR